MKSRFIFLVMILMLISCSSDDNGNSNGNNQNTLTPIAIKIVFSDGTNISENQCLSDQFEYAVEIETIDNTNGTFVVTQIDYTFNGELFSMSFSSPGVLRNPLNLVNGENQVQLLGTGDLDMVRFVEQDPYSLVE
ncbi:hypothetical protein [Winogradskyella sp.]|uniref:hypothetical protein n=1 Tax=Winogradskyella sp. TaxID=1883156 RepID=UPI003512660F